jgi:hypothetical protein
MKACYYSSDRELHLKSIILIPDKHPICNHPKNGNNLCIKKFERSLNKFAASMNLRRKDVPRSYVETKTIKRIEEACRFPVAAKQIKNDAVSFLMNPEAPVQIEDMPRCRRCRVAPLSWSTVVVNHAQQQDAFPCEGREAV